MTSLERRQRTPAPPATVVKNVLEGMLGREIELGPGEPVVPRPGAPATVAIYVNRADAVQAVVVIDLALSAYLSAAIGLFPLDVATAAISEERLQQDSRENLGEVLNVLTASLNGADAPHVSLDQVVQLGGDLPTDAAVLLRTLGRRLDQSVSIHGYGEGAMSVVCL